MEILSRALMLILFAKSYIIKIIKSEENTMQLQSVKETAKRFHISERRVQKLCEEGRIAGAQMISNVWVIPSTAAKPSDERVTACREDFLSLSELCKELSISTATGRNWVKLGKLSPSFEIKRTSFFSQSYVADMKAAIKSGKNTALKSRRNKKHISGNHIYESYISASSVNLPVIQTLTSLIGENTEISDELLCAVIAECALQLILHKSTGEKHANCLFGYLSGTMTNELFFLVDRLICKYPRISELADLYSDFFSQTYVYEEGKDILGLLYISLKNIGSRKSTGSYYTPTAIVQKLCHRLFSMNDPSGKTVFDPCCGTGNFILQLPAHIPYGQVYGNDIDPVSVKIARINFALKYGICDAAVIDSHITEEDYLSAENQKHFDFIIGNPPWGYDFSEAQKEQLTHTYQSAAGKNTESYDLFVERALSDLREGGILSFVLPEAILNVKSHTLVRQIMLERCSFQYLEFLGNAFDRVQCPCIILQLIFTGTMSGSIGMKISDGAREYTIRHKRKMNAACFSFSMTDKEYHILEKIDSLSNKTTLYKHAIFALGIVTGNNKKYISQIKTDQNEVILKGSDLCKYRFQPSQNYITFKPEAFQQVAPTQYYRAPEKLLYRFICNQLVFAYDDRKTLSLNSCNILIPAIDGLHTKYIMAILNSSIAQYYFKKRFNSVKILRSHIEQIPIPWVEKEAQEKIIRTVDSILEASDPGTIHTLYHLLDQNIADLYNLTPEEYQVIHASMDRENLFLT